MSKIGGGGGGAHMNVKTMMDCTKCMPGGLVVFLLQRSRVPRKIHDSVLFCFIRPKLKSALSVVREEKDGAARPLTCVNK